MAPSLTKNEGNNLRGESGGASENDPDNDPELPAHRSGSTTPSEALALVGGCCDHAGDVRASGNVRER